MTPAPTLEESATATGCYVYGVVPAGGADALTWPAQESVSAGRGVEVVREGPVAAIVTRVALDEFGEEALPERLNDMTWLGEKAQAHEAVLEHALRTTTVLPVRLCTIYLGEAEVRAFLSARGDELTSTLERLRNTAELGVKAFVDVSVLDDALSDAPAAGGEGPELSAGRAYLMRRSRERVLEERRAQALAEYAETAHTRLAAVALDARANPPQPAELSGRAERMILNGAYLVEADGDALRAEVAALGEEYGRLGVELEITGPWPPYNFVTLEAGEQ